MKNKAFKLFLAVLIISSTARAADFEVLDFGALSNPSYKMPAIQRLEKLHDLSQAQPDIAQQCLNEIVLILRGRYGFSKRRADDGERRTVAKAMTAYTKFLPSKNPFEEQQAMCDVDDSMSAKIQRHFEVLKEGFEHIASLISDESDREVSVFGITIQLSELIAPKSAATSVVSTQSELQQDAGEGDALPLFDANSGSSSPHSVSSKDEGDVTREDDMAGVMSALHPKKKGKGGNGATPEAKVGSKRSSVHQGLETDDGKKKRGRRSNRPGAAALSVRSGTNLRTIGVSNPTDQRDAEQQDVEAARIEEEQKKKEESGVAGGALRVNETAAPKPEGSEAASHDDAPSSDSDDDQQRDCCGRRKDRGCIVC